MLMMARARAASMPISRRLMLRAPSAGGLTAPSNGRPTVRHIFQYIKQRLEKDHTAKLKEFGSKRNAREKWWVGWFEDPPKRPQSWLHWWPGYDIAKLEADALAEYDKELRQQRLDAAQRNSPHPGSKESRQDDRTMEGYMWYFDWVMKHGLVYCAAMAAVGSVLAYFHDSESRAVGLSREQKDELRALIVNLELPDLQESKPHAPHMTRLIPGYRRAFGRDGSILEGGSDVNFPPWNQAPAQP